MRRELGIFIAGLTLVVGGCSVGTKTPNASAQQSEKPNLTPTIVLDNIVDCRNGPFNGRASYDLRTGESKDVGGIISTGQEEDVVIVSLGNANIDPLLSNPDITIDSQTELVFHSQYLKYRITQGFGTDSGSKGDIFIECVNPAPKS